MRPPASDETAAGSTATDAPGWDHGAGRVDDGQGSGAERSGAQRSGAERPGAERPGAQRSGAERSGAERPGAERPGARRSGEAMQARGASSDSEPASPRQRQHRRGPRVMLVIALVVVALAIGVGAFALSRGLTSPKGNEASVAPSPSASSPASAPPSDAPISAFDASAPLQKNVDLFNRTAARVAVSGNPVGADFTNALAAVGFDKSQMQITADRTTINALAPAIVFAVKVDGSCLLGQYAPDSHEYDHQVVAPISTGSCLIGAVAAPQ